MSATYDAAIAAIDPGTIGSMTREEAGAVLDRLTNEYRGVKPIADVIKSKPTNAVEANVKLEALKQNPDWLKLHELGHPKAARDVEECVALIAAGETDLAMAGVVPDGHINTGPGASLQDKIAAANDLRVFGFNQSVVEQWLARAGIEAPRDARENAIRAILDDKEAPRAFHIAAKADLARLLANPEWCRQLDAKDPMAMMDNLVLGWGVGCYWGGP